MLTDAELDEILSLQLAVAWAGETGDEDETRLGWWTTDLLSEFGGIALFKRVAPRTAHWVAYETAREAARRVDAERRSTDAKPDELHSLFHFGVRIDEQLDDRLLALKHGDRPPQEALPSLAELPAEWEPKAFSTWLQRVSLDLKVKTKPEPCGLRVVKPPKEPIARARAFAAALSMKSATTYPCPHIRDAATKS